MKKKKKSFNKYIYPIFILIASLFMGVGYARVNDNYLEISGTGQATLPKEVLITEVLYDSNVGANINDSKINYFTGTILDSEIVLGNNNFSTITYNINVYNNTEYDQVFIGTITDMLDSELYSNPNIEFKVTGLTEYETVLSPKDSLTFQITFSYKENVDITDTTLKSKLNFRFKEIPKVVLSNEAQTITVNDIYPGMTKEIDFEVLNYDSSYINMEPLTYTFQSSVDTPFTIKIINENGDEVKNPIALIGNSKDQEKHYYKAQITWPKSTDNFDYSKYDGKTFNGEVTLNAIPDDSEKYLGYTITKKFNINVDVRWTDYVVPVASITATKKNSKTQVASNSWSSEGLDFKFTKETVGPSGATIYYCKDTTNTCNPSTAVSTSTTITTYNNLEQNIYYIRYKIVNGQGISSDIKSYTAKVDNIVPTMQLLNAGRYEFDNTSNIVQGATYGISGGTYKCTDSSNNAVAPTIESINKIGLTSISCTITSNAGLTSTVNNQYKISATLRGDNSKIGIINGAYRSGTSIILPVNGIQYGPYLNATKGCYRVFYFGNNLNASPQGYSVIVTYNGVVTVVNLSTLNYVSSDSNYYFELTQDATNVETKLTNYSASTTITIDSFRIYYQGETCS